MEPSKKNKDWGRGTMTLIRMACSGSTHVRITHPAQPSRRLLIFQKGGGMRISQNRTLWPVSGGAIGIQPGWFPGHSSAFFYINLGEGNIPQNYSLPMQSVFQILGPTNVLYNGSFCLPQVALPVNFTAVIGNNATIQVIETAQHGAALYNCVDITFADPKDVPEVNESNCANTSNIGFELVFSTESLSAGPQITISRPFLWLSSISLATIMAAGFML
ncbi:hypothetical protein MMC29_007267 [Sticta canariensis]|nr:hypothetical protein [Sticta canariensis]